MPSSEFSASVVAGLEYWRDRTRDMDDRVIAEIDGQRQNLFRAVHFGIQVEAAWPAVAEVALQLEPLVNRRMYRGEWIPVLEGLLNICPVDAPSPKFDLLIQLGRMQRLERHFEEANQTHRAAEALAREMGDEAALARAHYNLGRVYLDRRQYDEAERDCRAALEILDRLEEADQSLAAWALDTIGRCFRARGDWDKAGEYMTRALVIRRDLGDPTGIARALSELANTLRFSGRLDEAIVHYQEAGALLAPTANELDKTSYKMNLGATYFDKGEWSLAEQTFREADSPYLRHSGNLVYQAIIAVSLGNVLIKRERLVEAEAYLRSAVDLWGMADDKLNLANALGSLGEALFLQGQVSEALKLYDEALLLLEQFPEHSWAKRVKENFETDRKQALAAVDDRLKEN